jgi:hypothetical protein
MNKRLSSNKVDENAMVMPALTSVMKAELVVNEEGNIWILHDKPLSGVLHWIEFDETFRNIVLVMKDGRIQDMGIDVNDDVAAFMEPGKQVFTILTDGKIIKDMFMVPVIIRQK